MRPFSKWPVLKISCLATVCLVDLEYGKMDFALIQGQFLHRDSALKSLIHIHFLSVFSLCF